LQDRSSAEASKRGSDPKLIPFGSRCVPKATDPQFPDW
jgi:hypothetical protein